MNIIHLDPATQPIELPASNGETVLIPANRARSIAKRMPSMRCEYTPAGVFVTNTWLRGMFDGTRTRNLRNWLYGKRARRIPGTPENDYREYCFEYPTKMRTDYGAVSVGDAAFSISNSQAAAHDSENDRYARETGWKRPEGDDADREPASEWAEGTALDRLLLQGEAEDAALLRGSHAHLLPVTKIEPADESRTGLCSLCGCRPVRVSSAALSEGGGRFTAWRGVFCLGTPTCRAAGAVHGRSFREAEDLFRSVHKRTESPYSYVDPMTVPAPNGDTVAKAWTKREPGGSLLLLSGKRLLRAIRSRAGNRAWPAREIERGVR